MSAQPLGWVPVTLAVRGRRLAQGPKPWPVIETVREEATETVIGLRFGKRLEHIRVSKSQEIPIA